MEIFELIGKIAVEGTNDAIKAIDDTVKFALQSENKISNSLKNIKIPSNTLFNNKFAFNEVKFPIDKIKKAFSNFKNKLNDKQVIDTDISFDYLKSVYNMRNQIVTVLKNIKIKDFKIKVIPDIQDIERQIRKTSENSFRIADNLKKNVFTTLKDIENFDQKFKDNLNINDQITEFFNNTSVSEDITDKIMIMKNAVSEGMSKVLKTQLDGLENIYSHTVQKWHKIGNSASIVIKDMVRSINNGKSVVDAACLQVADGAVKNLMINASFAGEYIMNTLNSGLNSKAGQLYATASSIASAISQTLSNVSINVSSSVSGVTSKLAGHAKGGIVTREHIARVGEDGAEAIIPLEKNTEWIDKVAGRISGGTSNNAVLEKLDELNESIKNLKVYLDSGALVGEIAPKMDRKLGSIAKRKRRGAIL